MQMRFLTMTARKERSMELRIPDSPRHPLVFPHQRSHRTISRGSNSFAKHVIGIPTNVPVYIVQLDVERYE